MNKAKKDEWNYWYRRILLKDFKCGVSESTVNVCVKKSKKSKYKVPVFKCMLAKDSKGHEKKLVGEKLIDYKLDGVRVVTIINPISKTVKHYSRNGKEFHNFGHITKHIENFFPYFKEPIVIDGEMVSHSFQELMKQVQRKTNVKAQDAKYAIFDVLPLTEFKNGVSKLGCEKRHKDLEVLGRIISGYDKSIFVVKKEKVNLDTKEGQKKFAQINKTALEKGYEGVMIKDPAGLYECKRSALMLKMKPFIEVSLEVKDIEEGTGNEGGTTEGPFETWWEKNILYGKNNAVEHKSEYDKEGKYLLGYSSVPEDSKNKLITKDPKQIYIWHVNYHPDGGQLFFPEDNKPFISPLALPGDDIQLNNFRAFYFQGSQGLYIHPNIWHEGVFPTKERATFKGKQGKVHARVSIDLLKEFKSYIYFKTVA